MFQKIKFLLFAITLTHSLNSFGSMCNGEMFSITELLNHDLNDYHIFTCEILGTYKWGYSTESMAVVKRRFRGMPNDTIFIRTDGGGLDPGGKKLNTKSEWLIFSRNKDHLNYEAMVCDFLSAKIKKGNTSECERDLSPVGKMYLEILELYEKNEKEKYTGAIDIRGDGKLAASGNFKAGLPDGDWIHYSIRNRNKKKIIKSKISYKDGMLHGKYDLYHEDEGQNVLIQKRIYHNDLLELIEKYDTYLDRYHFQEKYHYLNDRERVVVSTWFDSSGVKYKQYSQASLDFNSKKYDRIRYMHGDFLNKDSRDSSSYSLLAAGKYFRGARVGEWTFFNKKGEIVAIKVYPEIPENDQLFLLYDEAGNVKLQGRYHDGKKIGVWKIFYENWVETEELYNSNGDKILRTRHYIGGGMSTTSYLNNKQHGQEIKSNKDYTIRSIQTFAHGRLDGPSIFYNNNGTIRKESRYSKGREFTVFRKENAGHVENGYLNGYVIHYSGKTGAKMREGNYWNGYETGVWIEYRKNGNHLKKYYPTDPEKLMNQCQLLSEILTEEYDSEGSFLKTWE